MSTLLALLPSPLLGPASWRSAAHLLRGRGFETVEVPQTRRTPRTPDDVIDVFLAAVPRDRPVVVVPHSNAGLFVPALAARRRLDAMVFVDAGLPPRAGVFPVAAGEFRGFLDGLADAEGLLPPWTQWWGADVSHLFPSSVVRDEVEAEQRRLPLTYFAGTLSAAAGWDERAAAYLAFGDTYATESADARGRGWPVTTLKGEHLHMLVDPQEVAGEIAALLASLGIDPTSAT